MKIRMPASCVPWRPRRACCGSRSAGLTLVEMMMGLAVLAILATVGAPSFVDFVSGSRVASSASTLASDLAFARAEAIMRNTYVIVCPKDAAAVQCAATANWQNGRVICVDNDSDGACDAASANAPSPLRTRSTTNDGVTITGPSTVLRFNGVGALNASVAFTVAGSSSSQPVRAVQVATSGHVWNH